MNPKRRERPAAIDYAVFVIAAFLALFLVYEVAKRGARAPVPPPPAPKPYAPQAAPAPLPVAPVPRIEPPEQVGVGGLPPITIDRVEKRRRRPPASPVPAPRR